MQNSSNPFNSLVQRLSLHGDLNSDDEAAVRALPHIVKQLEKDHYIVREGEKLTHSCLVVAGFAIRHKLTGEGGRQIVNFHMAGDMVDLQNSLLIIADHNVQALTAMEAAFIPREAMIDLAFSRPTVGKALWLETLIEGSISREWVMNVGRRRAPVRLAHLLCEFAFRLDAVGMGTECKYELPMTQEQIADTTGMTQIHANRSLKTLEAMGLAKISRKSVSITDLPKLAEYGDFCSTYLHLPPDALPDYLR